MNHAHSNGQRAPANEPKLAAGCTLGAGDRDVSLLASGQMNIVLWGLAPILLFCGLEHARRRGCFFFIDGQHKTK